MSERVITGKVVVTETINELKAIQVPVDLLDQWGPHLSRAFNNLRMLLNAMEKNEAEERNKQLEEAETVAEESPELQILEGGNEDAEENQLEGTIQE